jgi:hypothetical protein
MIARDTARSTGERLLVALHAPLPFTRWFKVPKTRGDRPSDLTVKPMNSARWSSRRPSPRSTAPYIRTGAPSDVERIAQNRAAVAWRRAERPPCERRSVYPPAVSSAVSSSGMLSIG